MSRTEIGGDYKPQLKLDGKKVIAEDICVYDGSIPTTYRKEVIYHFDSEDEASEYYYLKRKRSN
jgi:hypothetical protein